MCIYYIMKIQGVQVRDPTRGRLGRVGGRSQPSSPTEIAAQWRLEDKGLGGLGRREWGNRMTIVAQP